MDNFADYLKKFREVDLDEIIVRNDLASEKNLEKIANKWQSSIVCCDSLACVIEMNISKIIEKLDVFTRFMDLLVANTGRFGPYLFGAELLTNGFSLPITENFLESLNRILSSFESEVMNVSLEWYNSNNQSIYVNEILNSNNPIDFLMHRSIFMDAYKDKLSELLVETMQLDFVGHDGSYAIGDTLEKILNTFKIEQEKILKESLNIEECARFIGEQFESLDNNIAKIIDQKYCSNQLSVSEELVYQSQDEYIKSLSLLEEMNVIEQFETLVQEGVEATMALLRLVVDQLVYYGEFILKHKYSVEAILNYGAVLSEIESKKNPNYGKTERIISDVDGTFYDVVDNDEYFGIEDFVARLLIEQINAIFTPQTELIEMVRQAVYQLPTILSDVEAFKSTFENYVTPSVETLLYDSFDLDVVRDTIRLNSQVMQRVDTELSQAMETMSDEVTFAGKEGLKELVKELGFRVSALKKLHQDVFGEA